MENIIINAVSLAVIVLSVIYIIRDYRASKRLNNIKSEVDLCSEQIKDFNNNVLNIHEKQVTLNRPFLQNQNIPSWIKMLTLQEKMISILGDGARSTKYDIEFYHNDTKITSENVGILCRTASVPNRQLISIPIKYKGREVITVYQTSFLSNDLDNKSQRSKGYKFYGVYPMEISPMQYDSSGPGNVLTFTVTFQYTFYSVL